MDADMRREVGSAERRRGNRHTGPGGGNGGSPLPHSEKQPWDAAGSTGGMPEEKSPPCFDQRSPATSITVVWDGMKQPEQRGAPRPGWAEPWGAHPPHSTENQRMESPVGHRGSRRARRRLLPAPVCSSKVMHGCRERAGLVASLHGKVSACGARQGKLALVPQGCSRPPHLSWMGLGMRWQEVTLQIHLRMPALEGRCHTAFP
ncbi:uncharacterized protein LOC128849244 isoform X8 [Cuculus canorus]|uniref:uncharacterized protein LOC128849244 isoform X8 n=1 Tax=Cuculus canorus TaxID=55661 RepID=UPI0023AA3D87|nr:uncharacterized protein LOC128849244 isoform X8 [Cuculus canorus]